MTDGGGRPSVMARRPIGPVVGQNPTVSHEGPLAVASVLQKPLFLIDTPVGVGMNSISDEGSGQAEKTRLRVTEKAHGLIIEGTRTVVEGGKARGVALGCECGDVDAGVLSPCDGVLHGTIEEYMNVGTSGYVAEREGLK
ncbi:hypothetical protein ACOSP7_006818 [Xanthoceras sorbifolium]